MKKVHEKNLSKTAGLHPNRAFRRYRNHRNFINRQHNNRQWLGQKI
jgi:hypothetical protein